MKIATVFSLMLLTFASLSQTQLQRFSLQYTGTTTTISLNKSGIQYSEFQQGRDAFVNNNDFDSVRYNTMFSIDAPGYKLGLLYNFTKDVSKDWHHLVGFSCSSDGRVEFSSDAIKQSVQVIDSVEIQSSGNMLPVQLVTTSKESERYFAKMNIVGLDYVLRYNYNKRWLFNTNISASYYIVRRATGQITRVTNYDTQPNVYYSAISYQFDQFGQKMGVQLGQVALNLSPMILLNGEEKRRDGEDFRCRYYLGVHYGHSFVFGKINQANHFNSRAFIGWNFIVQPISFKRNRKE